MKIIDFEKEGNVVRFFYDDNDCQDYWGDDWNDIPYEHNAGMVYEKYIKGYIDVALDMNYMVLEPSESVSHINSPYSKQDMKQHKIPCILVGKVKDLDDISNNSSKLYIGYEEIIKDSRIKTIFFDDDVSVLDEIGVKIYEKVIN